MLSGSKRLHDDDDATRPEAKAAKPDLDAALEQFTAELGLDVLNAPPAPPTAAAPSSAAAASAVGRPATSSSGTAPAAATAASGGAAASALPTAGVAAIARPVRAKRSVSPPAPSATAQMMAAQAAADYAIIAARQQQQQQQQQQPQQQQQQQYPSLHSAGAAAPLYAFLGAGGYGMGAAQPFVMGAPGSGAIAAAASAAGAGAGSGAGAAAGSTEAKKKKHVRSAGGMTWVDPTLSEWPEHDFRMFVGDLGPEATDDMLTAAFSKYPSFAKARVVKDSKSGNCRGFGFVSFLDAKDFMRAFREMNGKYVGTRPIKLRKSTWEEREAQNRRAKDHDEKKAVYRFAAKQ